MRNKDYALVAGGSKGIGYAIAAALANKNYNLILVDRYEKELIKAKSKLLSEYPIQIEILLFDLTEENTATAIAKWCRKNEIQLKMLCNVAGYGGVNDYLSLSLNELRYMVNLNIGSCMALSLTLLPLLEKNTPAYILNVASMAGFAPIPLKNMYSSTKSAVIFFSYALKNQLKDKNISVSCLCPGPIFTTPEIEETTKKNLGWFGEKMAVAPKKVGEIAVRNTLKGKMIIIPGILAKWVSVLLRILPRKWSIAFYSNMGD